MSEEPERACNITTPEGALAYSTIAAANCQAAAQEAEAAGDHFQAALLMGQIATIALLGNMLAAHVKSSRARVAVPDAVMRGASVGQFPRRT